MIQFSKTINYNFYFLYYEFTKVYYYINVVHCLLELRYSIRMPGRYKNIIIFFANFWHSVLVQLFAVNVNLYLCIISVTRHHGEFRWRTFVCNELIGQLVLNRAGFYILLIFVYLSSIICHNLIAKGKVIFTK